MIDLEPSYLIEICFKSHREECSNNRKIAMFRNSDKVSNPIGKNVQISFRHTFASHLARFKSHREECSNFVREYVVTNLTTFQIPQGRMFKLFRGDNNDTKTKFQIPQGRMFKGWGQIGVKSEKQFQIPQGRMFKGSLLISCRRVSSFKSHREECSNA